MYRRKKVERPRDVANFLLFLNVSYSPSRLLPTSGTRDVLISLQGFLVDLFEGLCKSMGS